jgi:hypothetical protein
MRIPQKAAALDRTFNEDGARQRLTPAIAIAFIFYVFFLLANIYDMGGTHGLKYVSYALPPILVFFTHKPVHFSAQEVVGIASLFFGWPLICFVLGLLNGANLRDAQSQATPFLGFFVALLVVPILGSQRTLRYLYATIFTVGIVTLILGTLMYMHVAMPFIAQIADYCSAIYAPYDGGIMEHRVYFQATLWLVPAAVYFAGTSRFPLAMVSLAALIVSGSKAGVLITLLFISWVLLSVRKYRVFGAISVAIGLGAGLYLLPRFLQTTHDAFLDPDSSAFLIRSGHASSVFSMFIDKPWTIFIGNGAGATFFSLGTGNWEVRMETDHLDAIWHYGLIWFGFFSGLCAWVMRRLLHSDRVAVKAHGLALLSMYIAAGTNPQLISPLFMFFLGSCYHLARGLPRSPVRWLRKQGGIAVPTAFHGKTKGARPLTPELGVGGGVRA